MGNRASSDRTGSIDQCPPSRPGQRVQCVASFQRQGNSAGPARQWMRLRSAAEARGLRVAGHERKGRRDGRSINNSERGRQGHGDFDCPSRRERCRAGRAMKHSSKPRNPSSASTLSRSDAGGKSPPADKIRILIADDHTTVLAGLASIIGMQPDMLVVAEAVNGREAVDLWQKHRPDVTLLDLRMPNLDGVGVIGEIRKDATSARIMLVTTYYTDNDMYGVS